MLRLSEKYKKEVIPVMIQRFGLKSPMAVPRIRKVVVNTGFGRLVADKTNDEQKKMQTFIIEDLSTICGQRAILRGAKKAISSFKTRKGMGIGASCVLRKNQMYDFLDRLIHIALPRSRDFRGIDPKSVDNQGNLTLGIKEHIAFPEISPEKTKAILGIEITVVTNAKSKEQSLELLKLMGFPIKIEADKRG